MIVRWSDPATADIEAIYLHVAVHDVGAADRLYDRIRQAAQMLTQWPKAGRPGAVSGTRELVISGTNYIAVYKIEDSTVQVVRLLHGRQLWPET